MAGSGEMAEGDRVRACLVDCSAGTGRALLGSGSTASAMPRRHRTKRRVPASGTVI